MKLLRNRLKRVSLVLVAAGMLLSPAAGASAAEKTSSSVTSYSEELQPCVDSAMDSAAKKWVCDASGLTVSADSSGRAVDDFTAMPLEVSEESSDTDITTFKGGSSEDTWCENGSICSRKISSYIYEVKGNAAYGNEKGVIGSYDVVVRTNLNGRQAQWTVTRVWDSGPSLKFSSSVQRCWEKRGLLAPRNCGEHNLSAVTLSSSAYRNQKLVYGNLLVNSNNYYGIFSTKFTPSGYSQYTAANLNSGTFNCYGNLDDKCYIP